MYISIIIADNLTFLLLANPFSCSATLLLLAIAQMFMKHVKFDLLTNA